MIGDNIAAWLPQLRADAASLLFERVTIGRRAATTKDADGRTIPTWDDVYDGPAGISSQLQPATAEVAGQTVVTEQLTLKLPFGAPYIPTIDDTVEFTTGSTPTLVGVKLRVTAPSTSNSTSVLLRVPVERVA